MSAAKSNQTIRPDIYVLLAVFIFGSVFGTVYEQVYVFALYRVWVNKSGLIYGPFNPLYGLAAAAIVLVFYRVNSLPKLYFLCALAGGVFEYFTHEFEQLIFGTYSWNYYGKIGAIPSIVTHGATSGTTLPYMLYWGALGFVFVKGIYPFINKLITKRPKFLLRSLSVVTVLFFTANTFVTCAALVRQTQRHQGMEPTNAFWRVIDERFDDDFLREVYPTRPIPAAA